MEPSNVLQAIEAITQSPNLERLDLALAPVKWKKEHEFIGFGASLGDLNTFKSLEFTLGLDSVTPFDLFKKRKLIKYPL